MKCRFRPFATSLSRRNSSSTEREYVPKSPRNSGVMTPSRTLLFACLYSLALTASAQVAVPTFAGNAQHTAIYPAPAQSLNGIHWSTSVDQNNNGTLTHYGAPLVSAANNVFVPVKTAGGGFEVSVFSGSAGAPLYTLGTDYAMPAHNWIPAYSPALAITSSGTRLYTRARAALFTTSITPTPPRTQRRCGWPFTESRPIKPTRRRSTRVCSSTRL